MTWTSRLRDGLEWSDGTPVMAEDCVASIRRWAKREPLGGKLMADQLRRAGFNVDLRPSDYAAVAQERLIRTAWLNDRHPPMGFTHPTAWVA